MTLDQARAIALAFPGAEESPHFHYTSFRTGGKIFATALPDGEFMHIFVAEPERSSALERHPDFLEELFWGKKAVGVRANLAVAPSRAVQALLTHAWDAKRPRKPFRVPRPSKQERT